MDNWSGSARVETTQKKSAAVTGKLILVTAKHLAGYEQVNVRRSLNQLKCISLTNLMVSATLFVRCRHYSTIVGKK